MPQDHKKQHFVSQFYLNRFAGKGGKLYVFDKAKGNVFRASPVDIGHENHFLSVPELDQGAGAGSFFERLFGGVETTASTAITDIVNRLDNGITEVVTEESREAVALFLALQHLRTREARDRLSQSTDAIKRALMDIREEGTDEFKKWVDDGLERPHHPRQEHARHLLNPRLVGELAAVLDAHVWLIYATAETLPLYTSDHPLALYCHKDDPLRGVGPRSFGVELQFAVTPRYLLCLVERRWLESVLPELVERDGRLAGSLIGESVTFQRSLQVRDSRRFVFCSEDDFDLAREMCEMHADLRDTSRARVQVVSRGRAL